jgi:purine nucleoside phosphorylase
MPVAAILGSAFHADALGDVPLVPIEVDTPWGPWTLHQSKIGALVSFRHGLPHRLLPHQIPYRAQAWALKEAGADALLVTSSVGVLRRDLPLYRPLLLGDLLYPENRLPDGATCTMFETPSAEHGHLLVRDGLFSTALSDQVAALIAEAGEAATRGVVFAYAGGPRGKTPAENRLWATLGADVNSMTLAPEVVLANELEIPCAGLCVGHKYSVPGVDVPGETGITGSLDGSRAAMLRIVRAFLERGEAVPFANEVYRMGAS